MRIPISIAPASGWVAVFAHKEPMEDGRHFSTDPVVLWAVVKAERGNVLTGYTIDDLSEEGGPWGGDCLEYANFLCFAPEEDVKKNPEKYERMAKEFLERERRRGA